MNKPTKIALLVFVIVMAMLNSGCNSPKSDMRKHRTLKETSLDSSILELSELAKKINKISELQIQYNTYKDKLFLSYINFTNTKSEKDRKCGLRYIDSVNKYSNLLKIAYK